MFNTFFQWGGETFSREALQSVTSLCAYSIVNVREFMSYLAFT